MPTGGVLIGLLVAALALPSAAAAAQPDPFTLFFDGLTGGLQSQSRPRVCPELSGGTEHDYNFVIIVRGLMKADALIPSDEILEQDLRDPAFREPWEKTALARWLAVEVAHYRAEHGLTQRALARLLGVNQSDVARMEAGEHNPTLDRLIRVASCLGIEFTIDIRPTGSGPKSPSKSSRRSSAVSVGGAELVLATRIAR